MWHRTMAYHLKHCRICKLTSSAGGLYPSHGNWLWCNFGACSELHDRRNVICCTYNLPRQQKGPPFAHQIAHIGMLLQPMHC
jgi:hypothetical protein